jgi:hypothetical protein
MNKGYYLTTILISPKTVLASKDIAILSQDPGTTATLASELAITSKGDLVRLRQGF